jgi:hypothetical protein
LEPFTLRLTASYLSWQETTCPELNIKEDIT